MRLPTKLYMKCRLLLKNTFSCRINLYQKAAGSSGLGNFYKLIIISSVRLYDSNFVSKQPNSCCKEKEKISLWLFCKKLFLSIIIIGITYILSYILSKHSFIRPSIYTFMLLQMIYVLMLNPPHHIFLWKKGTYIAKNSKKIPLKGYFKIVLNNKKRGATLIIVAHLANIFLC